MKRSYLTKTTILSLSTALVLGVVGCGSSDDTSSSVETKTVAGTAIDGILVGSTVCIDVNNNNSCDEGEDSAITDADGKFNMQSAQKGSLLLIGGVDDGTGLPFTGSLSAPSGSSVVTPLTSAVQSLVDSGVSPKEAEDRVKAGLGIDPDVKLTELDPFEAMNNPNATPQEKAQAQQVLASQAELQTMVHAASVTVAGADATTEPADVMDSVFDELSKKFTGQKVELSADDLSAATRAVANDVYQDNEAAKVAVKSTADEASKAAVEVAQKTKEAVEKSKDPQDILDNFNSGIKLANTELEDEVAKATEDAKTKADALTQDELKIIAQAQAQREDAEKKAAEAETPEEQAAAQAQAKLAAAQAQAAAAKLAADEEAAKQKAEQLLEAAKKELAAVEAEADAKKEEEAKKEEVAPTPTPTPTPTVDKFALNEGNFTLEALDGQTFYGFDSKTPTEAKFDFTISFTGTTFHYLSNDDDDTLDYNITDNGFISFIDPENNKTTYIRGVEVEDEEDVLKLCFASETDIVTLSINRRLATLEEYLAECQDNEYVVTSKETADKLLASLEEKAQDVTISGKVVFQDENGDPIAIPEDARIRITSSTDQKAQHWERFNMDIADDGNFSQTLSIIDNSYSDSYGGYQIAIYKNTINSSKNEWDCNEDLYKILNKADYGEWSNIVVTPAEYIDNSTQECDD
jgi:hypothetical protein